MATATQLARIADLVDRLGPLAPKIRGMRIEADDWNALVDVIGGILEVDRAQEQTTSVKLEERFAARAHDHLGEVSLGWLAPDLQERLGQGGGGGSVFGRSELAEMSQRLQSLGAELARITTVIAEQQKRLDSVSVDEVDRSRMLRDFDRRFAGVENLRTLVTTLNGEVTGMTANVTQVLKLRERLSDASGAPIDLVQLRQDVSSLAQLRENLKGVDGSILRVRDIELKLTELSDAVGVGGTGGLEGRLAGLSADIEGRLDVKSAERGAALKQQLLAVSSESETRLRQEIATRVATNRAEIDQALNTRLATSEGTLTARFDAKLAASTDAVRRDTATATRASIDQALADIPAQVKTSVDAAAGSLRTALAGEVRAFTTEQVRTEVSAAETRLNTRFGGIDTRVTAFEQQIPQAVTLSVNEAVGDLQSRIDAQVASGVAGLRTSLEAVVDTRAQTAVSASLAQVDSLVANTVDQRLATLDAQITRAVTIATRNLPSDVGAEVTSQIAALNLSQQILESTRAVTLQMRAELSQALTDQQARTSAAINSAVTLLRAENDAAIRNTRDALRTEISTSVTTLRSDLTRPVDDRIVIDRINR